MTQKTDNARKGIKTYCASALASASSTLLRKQTMLGRALRLDLGDLTDATYVTISENRQCSEGGLEES